MFGNSITTQLHERMSEGRKQGLGMEGWGRKSEGQLEGELGESK